MEADNLTPYPMVAFAYVGEPPSRPKNWSSHSVWMSNAPLLLAKFVLWAASEADEKVEGRAACNCGRFNITTTALLLSTAHQWINFKVFSCKQQQRRDDAIGKGTLGLLNTIM